MWITRVWRPLSRLIRCLDFALVGGFPPPHINRPILVFFVFCFQDPALASLERALYDELRALRASLAQGLAPYMVFSDMSLTRMAEARPVSLDTLARIEGVNRSRADKYGAPTVAKILEFAQKHGLDTDVGLGGGIPQVGSPLRVGFGVSPDRILNRLFISSSR
jgi:hypothetical protein